jgi:hypothetical protein
MMTESIRRYCTQLELELNGANTIKGEQDATDENLVQIPKLTLECPNHQWYYLPWISHQFTRLLNNQRIVTQ